MKKVLAGALMAALLISFTATSAMAAPHCGRAVDRILAGLQAAKTCWRPGFVDLDGNGVCDNYDPTVCPGNGQGNGQGQWGNSQWGYGPGCGGNGHHGQGGHHGGHCW